MRIYRMKYIRCDISNLCILNLWRFFQFLKTITGAEKKILFLNLFYLKKIFFHHYYTQKKKKKNF